MSIRFCKYQALGNDYLVLADASQASRLNPELVRHLCDRHYGVGADGILAECEDVGIQGVSIWNADGSRAEKSGNGLRIFARFLWDEGRVGERSFTISTEGGAVHAEVLAEGAHVRIGMGILRLPGANPIGSPPKPETLLVDGKSMECYVANIGNPHCVVFVPDPTKELANRWGPHIESHSRFPQRTNVQFVNVMDRGRIYLEIWERGSGYTQSSGSSASAAVGVARNLDLVGSKVEAVMKGGVLEVNVDDRNFVTICGPAVKIADIFIDANSGLSTNPQV